MCVSGTVGHGVWESVGGGVTVYADFIDGVFNTFTEGG